MTPIPIQPLDSSLEDVASIIGVKVSALYQRIQRGKIGDLPIFNVGTDGRGRRYAARAAEIYAWLETRKGGRK